MVMMGLLQEQEDALKQAQAKIAELEQQIAILRTILAYYVDYPSIPSDEVLIALSETPKEDTDGGE
jgi:hypothetical protein